MMKTSVQLLAAAVLGSGLTLGASYLLPLQPKVVFLERATEKPKQTYRLAKGQENQVSVGPDFSETAERVTPAVVHIKSSTKAVASSGRGRGRDPMEELFGDGMFGNPEQRGPQQSSGSGVIVSADGYIVTNNHVIEDADELEVTLYDNRSYKARVIGRDPSTDIALIQIQEKNLPTLAFANSDNLKVGQWVLAVGNPFNLSSTVTAGVVSAKTRNIHILQDKSAIESFIQTDAAVNPGNSGGALVNLSGDLVGINTAIATPTGTFAGYSFAVPARIVEKVVEDLIRFGVVQRGYLGIMIRDVNSQLAREKGLTSISGVYVDGMNAGSAAKEAGVKSGDVIIKLEDQTLRNVAQLQEGIGRHRPGDKVNITVIRKGVEEQLVVVLRNQAGKTEIVKKAEKSPLSGLGIELAEPDNKELKTIGIDKGVKVTKIGPGQISRQTDMKEGFIITKIDKKTVGSVDEAMKILSSKQGGVMIEGVYPDYPGVYYYAFGLEE